MSSAAEQASPWPAEHTGRFSWWDLAYAIAIAAMAGTLLIFGQGPVWRTTTALLTLAALALGYVVVGRTALLRQRYTASYAIVLIVLCGVGTWADPNLASLQAIAIPSLWWLSDDNVRRSVIFSIATVVSVFLGYVIGFGFATDAVIIGAGFQTLSLIFSLGFGLWITRIGRWGEERARLLAELQGAQGLLEVAHRDAGAGAERERLAREIHDTIAQDLTSLVLLAQRAAAEQERSPGTATETIAMIEDVAREALTDARALVATSAPLHDAALSDAMGRLGDRFQRETGVTTAVAVADAALPRDLEVVLLRCAQEGLANVRKHAGARHAWVTVSIGGSEAVPEIVLLVQDDGVGPAAPVAVEGFGLAGMRDRTAMVGGTAELGPRSGGGSVLRVALPLSGTRDSAGTTSAGGAL